jgi:hypothetical protein
MSRNPEVESRIQRALAECNKMFAKELGGKPRRKRRRRVTKARAIPPQSQMVKTIDTYRKAHPGATLREAAIATGYLKGLK